MALEFGEFTTAIYKACPNIEPCFLSALFEAQAFRGDAMTNADKIRNMTDEELAEFLAANQRIGDKEFTDGFYLLWLDWLREKAS